MASPRQPNALNGTAGGTAMELEYADGESDEDYDDDDEREPIVTISDFRERISEHMKMLGRAIEHENTHGRDAAYMDLLAQIDEDLNELVASEGYEKLLKNRIAYEGMKHHLAFLVGLPVKWVAQKWNQLFCARSKAD